MVVPRYIDPTWGEVNDGLRERDSIREVCTAMKMMNTGAQIPVCHLGQDLSPGLQ